VLVLLLLSLLKSLFLQTFGQDGARSYLSPGLFVRCRRRRRQSHGQSSSHFFLSLQSLQLCAHVLLLLLLLSRGCLCC
jgi:hypothetical protein